MRRVEFLEVRSDARKFYQQVKRLRGTRHQQYYNDKERNLLTKKSDVLERWREYFKELLANEVDHEPEILLTVADDGVEVPHSKR